MYTTPTHNQLAKQRWVWLITCAGNLLDFYAEDEAWLVSFSLGLLQHIHRKNATFDAILMQDLNRCFPWIG